MNPIKRYFRKPSFTKLRNVVCCGLWLIVMFFIVFGGLLIQVSTFGAFDAKLLAVDVTAWFDKHLPYNDEA
jgi:hypothetical protein